MTAPLDTSALADGGNDFKEMRNMTAHLTPPPWLMLAMTLKKCVI